MAEAFIGYEPHLEDYWRGTVLFGRNVASVSWRRWWLIVSSANLPPTLNPFFEDNMNLSKISLAIKRRAYLRASTGAENPW